MVHPDYYEGASSTMPFWPNYYEYPVICIGTNDKPSFLWNEPGIYRPVIILGATILRDSFKDKIKAKYIRAGPKIYV